MGITVAPRGWQVELVDFALPRLRAAINAQPELLLEASGGPCGLRASMVLADFIGHDDQVVEWGLLPDEPVRERWMTPRRELVRYAPGVIDTTAAMPPPDEWTLTSCYAVLDVSMGVFPYLRRDDWQRDTGSVALVRYRRGM